MSAHLDHGHVQHKSSTVFYSYRLSQFPSISALSCFTCIILHLSRVYGCMHLHVLELCIYMHVLKACMCMHVSQAWQVSACVGLYQELSRYLHVVGPYRDLSVYLHSLACI
jgi:hypothetical protein